MLLNPLPPVTNCHTFSDPLSLERDVLYGRPHDVLLNGEMLSSKLLQFYAYASEKLATV